jgi:hypothetical protein
MRNVALLSLMTALASTGAWAQTKPACSLLTASEIGGVGASGQGGEKSLPVTDGPTKGKKLKLCEWRMATGSLNLSVADAPPGVPFEKLVSQMDGTYATLKSQGWKEEKKAFPSVSCSLMTPPPARQDLPITTGCLTVAKGLVVSVSTLAQTRVSMEKIKALLESAVKRL